ncbi:hypothetical protein SS50377_23571 [Spironucleus salmonicida]|uniref:Uncharacterized protein n=1 Tax=Spironucleus salmonicida TaxID=348837 RepID=V6M5C0_9EUKA|nr:hypothetical protein SS50377_23571 [Spironucleus salmonicida]|eukprot:EST48554.1 Hypothetical protein SS50377_11165 [Spironucleus salmonicida]
MRIESDQPIFDSIIDHKQYLNYQLDIKFQNQEQVLTQDQTTVSMKKMRANINIKDLVQVHKGSKSVLQVPTVKRQRRITSQIQEMFPDHEIKDKKFKEKSIFSKKIEQQEKLYKQQDRTNLYMISKDYVESQRWSNLTSLPQIQIKKYKNIMKQK